MTDKKIVTLEECSEIIQKDCQTKNFEILENEVKSLSKEVMGIMAGHYRLEIKIKMNEKTITKKYFVKQMTSKYEIQNEMIKVQGAYEKEKFTYDFLTKLSKLEPKYSSNYIPKCFLTVKDSKFVFEDLTQEGYMTNKFEDFHFDLPHLKMALKVVAKFHASSIIYEHKKSLENGAKYKMSDEYSQYFKDSLYRQNEKGYLGNCIHKVSIEAILALIDVIGIYSKEEKEELRRKVLNNANDIFEQVKASNKYYNVINHGDMWSSNILFKYNNDEIIDCKLIDFQAIRYTIPAHDFLFLLHASNNTDFIQKHKEELQSYYYNSLKTSLEEVDIDINNYVTYEQFLESMGTILPFIILQKAGFSTMFAMSLEPDIMEDPEKFKLFMYENRTDIVINAYEKHDFFKQAVHDSFRDLFLL